jgi:hypothetical protein
MLHCLRVDDLAVDVVLYTTFSFVTEFVRPFLRVREPAAFNGGSVPQDVRMLKTLRPAVIGTQRCVDKGLVFIPRLLLAILANPEGCGNLEGKQNAMKLGIPLGRFTGATWMKGRVRYFGCGKTVVRHVPVYPNSSLRLDHRYKGTKRSPEANGNPPSSYFQPGKMPSGRHRAAAARVD